MKYEYIFVRAVLFKPAFQESAACGSVDLRTHDATAMHNKHMSDCFRVEKRPSLSENRHMISTTSVYCFHSNVEDSID